MRSSSEFSVLKLFSPHSFPNLTFHWPTGSYDHTLTISKGPIKLKDASGRGGREEVDCLLSLSLSMNIHYTDVVIVNRDPAAVSQSTAPDVTDMLLRLQTFNAVSQRNEGNEGKKNLNRLT